MEKIIFECEVITPMFLAGADGVTPELRAPSIKGALRFWWRALNGGKYETTAKMKEAEGKIFGDTSKRSQVIMKVNCDEFEPSFDEFNYTFTSYKGNSKRRNGFSTNAMFYLGYGVANYDKKIGRARFIRPYIPSETKFKVSVRLEKVFKNDILESFKTLEQYGGLGSKSRNAFGCFKINRCLINNVPFPISKQEQVNSRSLSSYSSFSEKINLFETKGRHTSWEPAFKEIAIAYQYARENMEKWHKWDRRELIAQPIIVKGERRENENPLSRHSKPYFMHISRDNNHYKGYILVLPYNYLDSYGDITPSKLKNIQLNYFNALDSFNKLLSEKLTSVLTSKVN